MKNLLHTSSTTTRLKLLMLTTLAAGSSVSPLFADPLIDDEMIWDYIKNMPSLLENPVDDSLMTSAQSRMQDARIEHTVSYDELLTKTEAQLINGCDPLGSIGICAPEFPDLTDYRVRTESRELVGSNWLSTNSYDYAQRLLLGTPVFQSATPDRVEELSASAIGKINYSYNKANAGSNETYNTNVKSFWKYRFRNSHIVSPNRLEPLDYTSKLVFRGLTNATTASGFEEVILPSPLGMTSLALHHLYDFEQAEKATAKACNEIGALYIHSHLASKTSEAVNAFMSDTDPNRVRLGTAGGGWKVPHFVQFYNGIDLDYMDELFQNAKANGYTAAVHTMDVVLGDMTIGAIPNWSYLGNTGAQPASFSQNAVTDSGFSVVNAFLQYTGTQNDWANSTALNKVTLDNLGQVMNPRFVPNDPSNPLYPNPKLPATLNTGIILPVFLTNTLSAPFSFEPKDAAFYDQLLRFSNSQQLGFGSHKRGVAGTPGVFAQFTSKWFDPDFWATYLQHNPDPWTIEELAKRAHKHGLGYFIKGIQSKKDILAAFRAGCDGVILDNHGGRYQPGMISSIDALWDAKDLIRDIRKGVYDYDPCSKKKQKNRYPEAKNGKHFIVGLISGIRSGADAAKALALGANFACAGRPVVWGLSVNGIPGAYSVLLNMQKELYYIPRWFGATRIADFIGKGNDPINPIIEKESSETDLL